MILEHFEKLYYSYDLIFYNPYVTIEFCIAVNFVQVGTINQCLAYTLKRLLHGNVAHGQDSRVRFQNVKHKYILKNNNKRKCCTKSTKILQKKYTFWYNFRNISTGISPIAHV